MSKFDPLALDFTLPTEAQLRESNRMSSHEALTLILYALNQLAGGLTLNTGDLEIGAVELKDGATDTRGKVKTDGTDNALVVMANLLPLPSGAATSALQTSVGAAQATAAHQVTAQASLTSIDAKTAKQNSGVPSSFAILTADGTVFTLAAGEVGFIQNLDDAALAVKKGAAASTTSMSFMLPACSAVNAGDAGFIKIDDWIGVVSVAAMSGTANYLAWKQT